MQTWLDFWNGSHRIYVNDRHKQAHFERIADDVLQVLPTTEIDLLDWGCGPALSTEKLADRGVRVWLYDRAITSQTDLRRRFGGTRNVRVLTDEAYSKLPAECMDVILVNSVLQYLSDDEFRSHLSEFQRFLRIGGRLILADVIPPTASMVDDVRSLLRSGWRHGYLLAALAGLVHSWFSNYRQLRRELGLNQYEPDTLLAILRDAGFDAHVLPRNIGLASHRMSLEATLHRR